jgi:hypothetical protein
MRSRFLQGAIMRFTLCLFALPMPLALLHAQDTLATGVFYNANAPTETWNVTGNGTTSGSLIQTWTYAGNSNEEWQAVSLGNGYYKFVGQGSGLCLDTPGASTANGVQLQIYTCNGTAAQAWKLVTPSAGNSEEPYGGTPRQIPGTVLAENYDTGGQGVGYNVTSVNGTDNGYRSDGVDLETASSPATGNDLGWSAAGQWFRYTVNVSTAGPTRSASWLPRKALSTDAFHLSNSSGTNLTGSVAVPDTGGWQTWTTVTASVTLPAGTADADAEPGRSRLEHRLDGICVRQRWWCAACQTLCAVRICGRLGRRQSNSRNRIGFWSKGCDIGLPGSR